MAEHIIVIGGGGTGVALAHDLTLRGLRVSLFERGELCSGATGRHHGLLHSGARYAPYDPDAARECIRENQVLRRIAPGAIEANDGLFVALDEEDGTFLPRFLAACHDCGIPARQLTRDGALALEPALSPEVRLAVQVPDATVDAFRLPMAFAATARAGGAELHRFCEVVDLIRSGSSITGVRIRDHRSERERDVAGDLVVNAAGAWSGRIADLAGIEIPIQPGPGVMVAVEGRLTDMVISRLHLAAEGDIIVPQRGLTVLGTSLWLADDPDGVEIPPPHVALMRDLCGQMVPAINDAKVRAAWSAPRPLIGDPSIEDPQQISRTFRCYDHRARDGVEGLVSVIGGKATTLRAMAEVTADEVCRKLGRDRPCRTRDEVLLSHRAFFRAAQGDEP